MNLGLQRPCFKTWRNPLLLSFNCSFSSSMNVFFHSFQSHTKVHALLDNESIGIGLFRPDVNDPELSNADSSTAWELALLRTAHYHPLVKMIAHHVALGAPSKGHFSAIMRK